MIYVACSVRFEREYGEEHDMTLPTVHLIAAARPNFMKVAPLFHELKRTGACRPVLVHTGQHYDADMSDSFFRDLKLPAPDYHLGIGSGSHAEQTARVMVAYEKLCLEDRPDWVVVVGDVNSTMAATLAAKKLLIPVAHLEAGLRSFDRAMPEEINRIVTDALADLLWTPSADADENLAREGVPAQRIERVGNIMINSFEMLRERIEGERKAAVLGLEPGTYGILTLHRPSNVDRREDLERVVAILEDISRRLPLVFPVHPRTRNRLETFGLWNRLAASEGIRLTEPMNYVGFMSLVTTAAVAITNSGGVQEETSYLGIPCITLRANTERPVTVTLGTNRLAKPEDLPQLVDAVLAGSWRKPKQIELWDGRTAGRAAESLRRRLHS